MGILNIDTHFFFDLPNSVQIPDDENCDDIVNTVDYCLNTFDPYQIDQNSNGVGDACPDFQKIDIETTDPKKELYLSNTDIYIDIH